VIAFVVAAPLTGLLMGKMLRLMDYHIDLAWWMFALAGIIALAIAVATVSLNGIKATMAKPGDKLRAE
jgi:putative ABC transport system permease protein